MKSLIAIYSLLFGFLSAPLIIASVPLPPVEPGCLLQLEEPDEQDLIRGIVKERTDKLLVVTDALDPTKETQIRLTSHTRYFKHGREARAADVTIGAHVLVKVDEGSDEKLEAFEVTITKNQVVEPLSWRH
jgi:hypothetical protein